jgi:hypothetical protein
MTTRIWNCSSIWPGKVNFIDSDNVILGYDLTSSCCEHAFWTINTNADGSGEELYRGDEEGNGEYVLEGYAFDPEFFMQESPDGESGIAIFRLVHWCGSGRERKDLYIRLENHQNGYYSHGFTFRGAKTIEGYL